MGGEDSKVYTTDMSPKLSSACQVSDGYLQVPRVTDESYLSTLKEYCLENSISLIVPTIDTELSILANAKDDFKNNGISIVISDINVCDTFYLKDSTEKFFVDNGFDTTKSIDNLENAKYPLFAKLNNSSLSVGACKVDDYNHAKELLEKSDNYIFQEFIDADEFTVDTFIDKNGEIISIVPRQRLEVRAGEVNKALAVKDEFIFNEIKRLCKKIDGAYGTLTIQLFKSNEFIKFIEINPRFGGGYPLSWKAGANFAEYIIKDYLGKKLKYSEDWKDRTLMLRYDAEVIIDDYSL
jgi:carbamoyl-phosphate synthase large subunit